MSDFASALQGLPDEAVEVNQRALIDKVLARYSGENTVYRELLQNADDATASEVEIKFLTNLTDDGSSKQPDKTADGDQSSRSSSSKLPDLKTHLIARVIVRNNGIPFRDQDWARLRKIAEGNPDESKIGAFGVGFYALWSICDSPIVLSGSSIMGFNWSTKNPDQLVTRRGNNPSPSHWTTFVMDLRSPSPIPPPFEFSRFLATSLAFTTQIKTISMYFDNHLMCKLQKKHASPLPVSIPSNISLNAPMRMMKIQTVQQTSVQIDATVLRWTLMSLKAKTKTSVKNIASTASNSTSSFAIRMLSAFSKSSSSSSPSPSTDSSNNSQGSGSSNDSESLSELSASLFLRIVSGHVNVNVSSSFSSELERATKKPPPKKTQYDLIWINKDEFDAGKDSAKNPSSQSKLFSGDETARAVFDGLISNLDVQGRVFIGFPTHQTTGFSGSIAARFIPTVERESLDLQAKHVADWNRELLAIGGILARVVYEGEMKEVEALWKNNDSDSTRSSLISRSTHAMQFFTFYSSTPAGLVSLDTEDSFFRCDRNGTLTVPSSLGPTPASKVRLPNSELAGFIKNVPVLPIETSKEAHAMIGKLRERRLISEITLEDIFKELENRVLSVEEMRECFNWWISLTGLQGYDRLLVLRFLRCAVLKYEAPHQPHSVVPAPGSSPEILMPLSTALSFINIKTIPTDVPLPSHCLPFCLTKSMSSEALRNVFGFKELSILDFTKNLFSSDLKGVDNITQSPLLAEKLLNILAKSWTTISNEQQAEICSFLKDKEFIPTRHGIKKSSDAYHSNVTLFQDLSVVCLPSGTPVKGTLEKVLTAIGVRKHVELQMVFSRLLGSGEWNHTDLVKYLVSVRDTLTDLEIDRLKHTNWLPKHGEPQFQPPPGPDGKLRKPRTLRYTANQLYEPSPANQSLQLPLVDWPLKWRSSTEEAKLLFFLGLNKMPTIDVLLNIAATSKDSILREKALDFFLEHFSDYRATYRPSPQTPAFIPCNDGLCSPMNAFSNSEAAKMGFNTLKSQYLGDYQKFGIAQNPPSAELMRRLVDKPPKDVVKAKSVFEYLSTRVSDFSQSQLQILRSSSFIPIGTSEGSSFATPASCFFKPLEAINNAPFKSLFTYIDFGDSAKPFLLACGVKNEPTVQEIAEMLIGDPAKFYGLAGSAEEYLQVLRNIAANEHLLGSRLRQSMQNSAFILGSRRVAPTSTTEINEKHGALDDDDDDDEMEAEQPFVHVLSLPRNVVIIDDSNSYSQFTSIIVACPQEEVFERLAESLGAPRLTRIVKESFRIERSIPEQNERTEEMRKLLLERTALFLHERQTGSRSDVIRDSEWLKKHLVVKQVERVSLQRDLNYCETRHSRVLQATATAAMDGRSTMVLYLVRKVEIDWFELASSVCKLILAHQKLSDSLFFMTILQTSLKNLKRRGVNVDRIVNARKAEREAAQQRLREEKLQRQLEETNVLDKDQLESYARDLEKQFPEAEPDFIRKALTAEKEDHFKNVKEKFSHGAYERKARTNPPPLLSPISQQQTGMFSSLRRKLLNQDSSNSINNEPPPYSKQINEPPESSRFPLVSSSEGSQPKTSSIRPPVQATPMSDIRNNLLKAIKVSRPENNSEIKTKIETKPVKESSQTYCDPKSAREDLSFLTNVKGLRFYISRKVGSGELVMMEYGDSLNRYAEKIIKPVGEVFGIDPRSLHIFYDLEGPVIAFNQSGSLFFNLRYYLAWYDEKVKNGNLIDGLIGTYSSFCHELAHNLVEDHNSEHEWWMSAFIEQYFMRLSSYINSISNINDIDNDSSTRSKNSNQTSLI